MRLGQITEGIKHIEDLPVDEFISAVTSLEEYHITEKVDGSHLRLHLDEQLEFSISRSGKKQTKQCKSFSLDDPSESFQFAALAALDRVHCIIREHGGMVPGDSIDIEVLMTHQPNAIKYDGINRIVFLKTIDGDVDINSLGEALSGRSVQINVPMHYARDDLTISRVTEAMEFTFCAVPVMEGKTLLESGNIEVVNEQVAALEHYLGQYSGFKDYTNRDINEMKMNKRPDGLDVAEWRVTKKLATGLRDEVRETITALVAGIKATLLEQFVHSRASAFNVNMSDAWLEGVVCEHKETGRVFKIVDRDMFTKVNKFYYEERKSLSETPHNADTVDSFLGKVRVGYASALGYPDLGTRKRKSVMRDLGIDVNKPSDINAQHGKKLEVLGENLDYNSVKAYLGHFIKYKMAELREKHRTYIETRDDKVMEANGITFTYDDEVDRRTLLEYGKVYASLEEMRYHIIASGSVGELFDYFIYL